ncbi:MAG TPA: DUF4244 domain-containing protein [Microlunatus sp.]
MPDLTTIRAMATFFIVDTRRRARNDERGMNTMEYAAIAVAVLAVAAIIAGILLAVGASKASQIN